VREWVTKMKPDINSVEVHPQLTELKFLSEL
jgi:Golgi nucleoside diphosphatase